MRSAVRSVCKPAKKTARYWLTRVHRWTGLALVLFLIIVGFTGALLPFQGTIQQWLAPTKERVVRPPSAIAQPLDGGTLYVIAERRSGGVIEELPLYREASEPATFAVTARAGHPPLGFNTIVLDPYTGGEIAREGPETSGSALAQVMPFLYDLHTSLALGDWGRWLLGVAALAWTVDCFVGFYLTLPVAKAGWWRHWRQAWKLKMPPRSAFRFSFDLHRAAGLWFWPLLFVFAWSSVGFNLNSVYSPVMGFLFGQPVEQVVTSTLKHSPTLEWGQALRAARVNVAAEGEKRGFTIERERGLWREGNNYSYVVRTSRDVSADYANSYFGIDGMTGRVTSVGLPTGEDAGSTVSYWLGLLHMAAVFGLPYRILVSIAGVLIVVLSITGVLIWLKKRVARKKGQSRVAVPH